MSESSSQPADDQPADAQPGDDALTAAMIELERFIGQQGWEQPPRLFALVHTDELIAADPQLIEQQGLRGSAQGGHPDALTAIEQEDFEPGTDLVGGLAGIFWPPAVFGCAISLESSFLPAHAETSLPDDPQAASRAVRAHPDRQDVRLVMGVTRDGARHGVGRLVSQPDELLGAPDLVAGLGDVLAHTLAWPESESEAESDRSNEPEVESDHAE